MILTGTGDDEWLSPNIPKVGQVLSSQECIELACKAALQGAGFVASNPMVGAVAVDADSRFLGLGAHEKYGENHAEVNLLNGIISRGDERRLNGAVIYCTLEPCSFHGKTPPCCSALAKHPIAKLVYGQQDPNPKVNGAGIRYLLSKGICCVQDPDFMQLSKDLIAAFAWNQSSDEPYVALKAAISLDGKIGRGPGEPSHERDPLSITGSRARQYGHWLRQCYDGIVVGANTTILDNPSLNVRHPKIVKASDPFRIVFDPNLRVAAHKGFRHLKLLNPAAAKKNIWVVDSNLPPACRSRYKDQFDKLGIQQVTCARVDGFFDPKELLAKVYQLGIRSLLLEGGSGVWAGFLRSNKVNKIYLFQSPQILGAEYLGWDSGFGQLPPMKLEDPKITSLGEDWVCEGRLSF